MVIYGIEFGIVIVSHVNGTKKIVDRLIMIDEIGLLGVIDTKYENNTSIPLI